MGPQITPNNAAQQAGILCNDVAFQNYAAARNGFAKGEFCQSTSAEHIRQICKIESRRELTTNAEALKLFQELHTNFLLWSNRIQAPDR